MPFPRFEIISSKISFFYIIFLLNHLFLSPYGLFCIKTYLLTFCFLTIIVLIVILKWPHYKTRCLRVKKMALGRVHCNCRCFDILKFLALPPNPVVLSPVLTWLINPFQFLSNPWTHCSMTRVWKICINKSPYVFDEKFPSGVNRGKIG